jgi:hypothetical protein
LKKTKEEKQSDFGIEEKKLEALDSYICFSEG